MESQHSSQTTTTETMTTKPSVTTDELQITDLTERSNVTLQDVEANVASQDSSATSHIANPAIELTSLETSRNKDETSLLAHTSEPGPSFRSEHSTIYSPTFSNIRKHLDEILKKHLDDMSMMEDSNKENKSTRSSDLPRSSTSDLRSNSTSDLHSMESDIMQDRSSNNEFCRICGEDPQGQELVYPCSCSNVESLVHRSCIINYMKITNVRQCITCHADYKIMSNKFVPERRTILYRFREVFERNNIQSCRCRIFVVLVVLIIGIISTLIIYYNI